MMTFVLSAVVGFLAGIAGGLLGIGGGLIFVPFFHYVLKMNFHMAIGTSLAIIVPTALVAALRHHTGDFVDWKVVLITVGFAVVGGFLGAGLSMHIDVSLLRKIFAVFLVLVAIKMFLK